MSRRKQLNPKAIKVDENAIEDPSISEEMSFSMHHGDRPEDESEEDRLFISEASNSPPDQTSFHPETSGTFDEKHFNDPNSSNSNDNMTGNIINYDTSTAFYLNSFIKVEPGSMAPFASIQDIRFMTSVLGQKNMTSKSRRKSDRILPLPNNDGSDNFKCPVCNEILKNNHELTKHIRSHNSPSEITPTLNSCKICGKILSSMSSLDRHMLVHSGERPFQCRICHMAFTTNGNMHRHMRIHAKDQDAPIDQGFFKDGVAYKPPKKKRLSGIDISTEIQNKKNKMSFPLNGEFVGLKNHLNLSSQVMPTNFYTCITQPIQQSNEEIIELNPSKGKYFCGSCDLDFYSLYGMMEHLADHRNTLEVEDSPDEPVLSYKCLPCQSLFKTLFELESHLVDKHASSAVGLKLEPINAGILSERLRTEFLSQLTDDCNRYETVTFELTSEKFYLTTGSQNLDTDKNNNIQRHMKNSTVGNSFDNSIMIPESLNVSNSSDTKTFNDVDPKSWSSRPSSISFCPHCEGMSFLSLKERRIHELLSHSRGNIVGGWCTKDCMGTWDPRIDFDQREFMLILGLDSNSRNMIEHRIKIPKGIEIARDQGVVPIPVVKEMKECERELLDDHGGIAMLSIKTCQSQNLSTTPLLSPSSNSEVQVYRCSECPFTCAESIVLYKHERVHKCDRFYKCLKCSQTFTTKANCERHLRKKHLLMLRDDMDKFSQLVKSSSADDDPASPRPTETICKYCGEDFKVERALKHHLRSQTSCQHKPYTCQVCNTGFSTKANCLRHIQKQHSELQPYEAHMKVNMELIEAQKKVQTPRSHVVGVMETENLRKLTDGSYNLISNRSMHSLSLGSNIGDNPRNQFDASTILDLRQMSNTEMGNQLEEPLDFSFKKEESRVSLNPEVRQAAEFPVDLSLRKPSTPKQATVSGNNLLMTCTSKFPTFKSSFVSLKSILKPSFQPSFRPPSTSPKEELKHFNLRTNRFHCPICGAIFKQSEKLQSHLLTHNLAQSSSDVASSSSSPSKYSQSKFQRSIEQEYADDVIKTIINTNNSNNNNSPSCKNANIPTTSLNINSHDNDLASALSPFLPPSSFHPLPSSPSSSLPLSPFVSKMIMDGSADRKRIAKAESRIHPMATSSISSLNERLRLSNMSFIRKNSYSDSPHKLKCHFCPRAFPWISSLKRHLLTHTGHKPFKCLKCMVTFSTKSNRERHMMRKHGINVRDQSLDQLLDQSYNCHLCESIPFDSLDSLLEHHREIHAHLGSDFPRPLVIEPQEDGDEMDYDDEEEEEDDDDINNSNSNLMVTGMSYGDSDGEDLQQESTTTNSLLYNNNTIINALTRKKMSQFNLQASCQPLLKTISSNSSPYLNPERDNYNVDKITRCWKCEQSFECRKGLLRHLKAHNVDLPFKCYLCDASYDARIDSLQHKISCHPHDWTSVKDYNTISDDVKMYSEFIERIVQETLAGNLDRRIVSPPYIGLSLDVRPETDYAQRKVFCTLCPKRFWSLQDLRRHMRSHTGERPFECDVCQARFTLKHSMMRHRRKHQTSTTGLKRFHSNQVNNNNNNILSNNINNSKNMVDYDELEGDDEVEGESFMDVSQYSVGGWLNGELHAVGGVDGDSNDDDENYELVIDEDVNHQIGGEEISLGGV